MSNEYKYIKRVWYHDQVCVGEVYRDEHRVERKTSILWVTTTGNIDRNLTKLHKWAEKRIKMLQRQETSGAKQHWLD
jgi:hypothetical protein